VTGYQWKWRYEYLDEDIDFFSSLAESSYRARQLGSGIDPNTVENYLLEVDNPLVVPVGAKVRLLLTGADVIHSWWVPDLGGKKDAIPGFINEFTFQAETPGTYRGQCAELCGRGHGFMPIVVDVLPEDEYVAWVADRSTSPEPAAAMMPADAGATVASVEIDLASAEAPVAGWDLETAMAQGEPLYNAQCAACHQANGQGLPPAFPAIAGSPVATGDLAAHIDIGLNGRAGTAMVGFGGPLSDEQLAAIITYQRNAFGNDTGDLVTPAEIAAAR
jgi:cytochrome c oxidase subunit 2